MTLKGDDAYHLGKADSMSAAFLTGFSSGFTCGVIVAGAAFVAMMWAAMMGMRP